MPLDERWAEEEVEEWIGQLEDLREEEVPVANVMQNRLLAEFKDLNPDMMLNRLLFFSPSNHRRSKWSRWKRGINAVGVSTKPINSLVGKFFHIREEPEQTEIDGEAVDYVFPRVVAVLDDEDEAREIFASLPKREVSVTARMPEIDLETESKLVALYKSLKGNKGNFISVVDADPSYLPEGITAAQAFSFAEDAIEAAES